MQITKQQNLCMQIDQNYSIDVNYSFYCNIDYKPIVLLYNIGGIACHCEWDVFVC